MLGFDFSTESWQETGFSGEGDGRDELNFMSSQEKKKVSKGEQLSSYLVRSCV